MTWIVTGASRGLGRHLSLQLAARGHRVLACARDLPRLQALAAEQPGQIVPLAIDLADAAQIGSRLGAAIAAESHISGLVNNAGFGAYKPFLEHSEAESIALVQVNFTAAIQCCHAVLPRLLGQGTGHIVNIGSDIGRRPQPNMAVYAAAKHGLAGFSGSLLREVKGRGVKVSLVNPGIIDTDFGGAAEGSRDEAWSLRPAALAALVVQLIEQPGTMVVDELTVHPLGQDGF
jgi:short-subunit dehydrogenase